MTADEHEQLPDTWLTVSGDRVEILATTGSGARFYYWHLRTTGGHVDGGDGQGYRRRRSAVRAAMRRHPMVEAA